MAGCASVPTGGSKVKQVGSASSSSGGTTEVGTSTGVKAAVTAVVEAKAADVIDTVVDTSIAASAEVTTEVKADLKAALVQHEEKLDQKFDAQRDIINNNGLNVEKCVKYAGAYYLGKRVLEWVEACVAIRLRARRASRRRGRGYVSE